MPRVHLTDEQRKYEEESYHQVRLLLYSLTHRFTQKFGGSFEEVLADTHSIFVDALRSHEADKGALSKRVSFIVWRRLIDAQRKKMRADKNLPRKEEDLTRIADVNQSNRVKRLLVEVSEDAAFVIRSIIESSDYNSVDRKAIPHNLAVSMRRSLINFLSDLGWSATRILESFQEIRDAIS